MDYNSLWEDEYFKALESGNTDQEAIDIADKYMADNFNFDMKNN